MKPRVAIFTCELHPVETGLWCSSCLLASGIRFVIADRNNPTRIFGSAVGCTDCGNGKAVEWPRRD